MSFDWDAEEEDFFAGPSFRPRQTTDDDFPIPDDFANPQGGFGEPVGLIPQDAAEETSFQQLIRHWMNERHAPDILPGQEALLGGLLDHIRKQVSFGLSWCLIVEEERGGREGDGKRGTDCSKS